MAGPFRHIALGIVQNEGKILVVRRRKLEKGDNNEILTWVFPGGKVEDNETATESVVRELYEETGYRVKAKEIIDERSHPTFPAFVHYIACELAASTPVEAKDPEIAEVKWVLPSEFTGVITSSLNPNVRDYLKIK